MDYLRGLGRLWKRLYSTPSADEIGSPEITADGGDSPRITDDEIDSPGITDDEIDSLRITVDEISSLWLTADEIDTPGITADEIDSPGITDDEIDSLWITADEIGSPEITADGGDSPRITDDEIDSPGITADEIDSPGITADEIDSPGITADEIDTPGITADKIDSPGITADEIDSPGITPDEIDSPGITADEIDSPGITADEIDSPGITADREKTHRMANTREKCYNPGDTTLTFVEDDDLDYLCEDFKSLRAKMSCGHGVTPSSLTNWCRRLLNEGNSSFSCGNCRAKWSYVEVRKMALLTPEEREEFEKTMVFNAARDGLDCKTCPGCKTSVARKDQSNLSVQCKICTMTKERHYEFCWQCLKEWKGDRSRLDRCDNEGCSNEALKTQKSCRTIVFESVKGVTGCPSIRACPTCGSLLEHSSRKCKNILCLRCKVEFCFVCLKLTKECLLTSSHYQVCSSGVAPRQTSIPLWQKKY